MKRFIIIGFAVFGLTWVSAQNPSLPRDVIASGGDFFASPAGSLSWTLGETVIETLENTSINLVLTQGFQQPDELTVGVKQVPNAKVFVNLYPNPSVQFVRLDLKYESTSRLNLELVDMLGRVIDSQILDVIKGQISNYQVDVSPLSAGMYMFRLTDKGHPINSYKFQKVSY